MSSADILKPLTRPGITSPAQKRSSEAFSKEQPKEEKK